MTIDYTRICFVIMPFGIKIVGGKRVDFDRIYEVIFAPAIEATELPEGGYLTPKRADADIFSGVIDVEMFSYIEYSRFALADISGLNPNVFYELGIRHAVQQSGTAIFHQAEVPNPFNTNRIRAFPYEYEPDEHAAESRALITNVLTESLKHNRLDSPVRMALATQQHQPQHVERLLLDAENAVRNCDMATATLKYREALNFDEANPLIHLKLGTLLKDQNDWAGALTAFSDATRLSASYADAWRERGVAENKLYAQAALPGELPTGEASLSRATTLNPDDFDAYASLGGVLKRLERYEEALVMYRRATELSNGHTYPLLNEIELQTYLHGNLQLEPKQRFKLSQAQRSLQVQVSNVPPYNAPWSFFDLSETYLYQRDRANFEKYLEEGILSSTASWKVKTHRESLELLLKSTALLPGLSEGIIRLREVEDYLS